MPRFLRRLDRYSMMLLATVALASLLPARGDFAATLDIVVDAAIALLFFLHGAKLSREAIFTGLTNWRLHLLVLGITFAAFPLLGIGFEAASGRFLTPLLASGLLFLTLLPSTVQSSIAFTSIAGGNVPAAVCAASASNLAGIFITPLLTAVLIGTTGRNGDALAAVQAIVLQLLVPFIVGHLARPVVGSFITRHKFLVSTVDRGSILLVVYSAFSAAVVEGLWHRVPAIDIAALIAVCSVLLGMVLFATWGVSGRLGFARPDRITILFCGSKKSLASGVPMAGVLFAPADVGAVILPLMIFHQLQLLACAAIAQSLARTTSEA